MPSPNQKGWRTSGGSHGDDTGSDGASLAGPQPYEGETNERSPGVSPVPSECGLEQTGIARIRWSDSTPFRAWRRSNAYTSNEQGMPTHRHGTQSFIDFMQPYLQAHPKRCTECGNVARAWSEWRIEKRDEDGVFLDFAPEQERSRGSEERCATYLSGSVRILRTPLRHVRFLNSCDAR